MIQYKLVVIGSEGAEISALDSLSSYHLNCYQCVSCLPGNIYREPCRNYGETVQFVYPDMNAEGFGPTMEDSYRKIVEVDGQQSSLDILDTTGMENYAAMKDHYMKNGQGFVLVYSITAQSTFDDLMDLRDQILRVKNIDVVPMVLVGNKCDLEDERVVTKEQGENLAKHFGNCTFLETSVKMKINIDEVFYDLVRQIIKTQAENEHKNLKPPGNRRCGIS